ncbi:uncharacterized protein EI97DRAFT_495093 [Westerdykella ornata]|uniref:Uncharacterized protein n=1 Tax=Westerdykella ornata TaxID=318751 RepID=A0A6A6JEC5_WESOR|nr:uncharacterized protein EI97DRAFT_495093 [Westerdykella ornata]KAF2274911.1 hypothetical protein EI97DRAFT_495093 [Westerdykella ornata]
MRETSATPTNPPPTDSIACSAPCLALSRRTAPGFRISNFEHRRAATLYYSSQLKQSDVAHGRVSNTSFKRSTQCAVCLHEHVLRLSIDTFPHSAFSPFPCTPQKPGHGPPRPGGEPKVKSCQLYDASTESWPPSLSSRSEYRLSIRVELGVRHERSAPRRVPVCPLTLTTLGALELSNLRPARSPASANETHDYTTTRNASHEPPYISSLQQRQQQAAEYYRAQHIHSRASSSSGSPARSLRRTPNFERPSSPALELQLLGPHPALRISRRTASAIRFVLEEAIRTPHPFTPDLAEENASMSDLMGAGGGRAANGGARTTAGPVPVSQADRSNIRTPQMIMNQRREREARRQQTEADARAAEEQRKAEEERRKSAERRALAAGVAGAPTTIAPGTQRYAAQSAPLRSGDAPTSASGGPVHSPTSGQAQDVPAGTQYGRPRASSLAQPPQPRPAPASGYDGAAASASDSRRPPPMQHSRRPSAQAGTAAAGASTAASQPAAGAAGGQSGSQARQSTTSSFPHAFERWEQLSSHWEGLTSYWIRHLEQNSEEMKRQPLVQQMSRQITDLSAAGANLFHAVVELQRLRASSERKFQRWFYEHRQEQERAQEREAQLDNMIRVEREARAEAVANMERMAKEKQNAERVVAEMKRELQISKEEARRAWEELGRREQEERDRTMALREGQEIVLGGIHVVPRAVAQGIGTPSQHAGVGDTVYGTGASSGHGIEQHYSYEQAQSPTDTDPFRHGTPLRHDPDVAPLAQGTYIPSGVSAATQPSSRTATHSQAPEQSQISAPANPQQRNISSTQHSPSQSQTPTTRPEAFYQQPSAYLHRSTEAGAGIPEDEQQSYVTSTQADDSEEEEYVIDDNGNFLLDEQGHRVPYRSLHTHDDMSDEFDVQEERRRELEHLQRYGSAPQGETSYTTTTSGGGSYGQGYVSSSIPDYSGAGYGSEWAGMRHHHPTRLSDVLEEDERSRTSPSRASQASRGRY